MPNVEAYACFPKVIARGIAGKTKRWIQKVPALEFAVGEEAVSRSELERYLRKPKAAFVRHGSNHDIWESAEGDRESQIPRHQEIKKNTARRICDDLGVPRHPSL
ncbi:MAG TPA: type II toxin-antitoxin system HicA family toxin [Fimbriimonadaceae bacterium]|nr:type II toxin-antitoxin system HicA family toxin [Fimbriimonadaceae bacterium]